jgi:hypothetical protein
VLSRRWLVFADLNAATCHLVDGRLVVPAVTAQTKIPYRVQDEGRSERGL